MVEHWKKKGARKVISREGTPTPGLEESGRRGREKQGFMAYWRSTKDSVIPPEGKRFYLREKSD